MSESATNPWTSAATADNTTENVDDTTTEHASTTSEETTRTSSGIREFTGWQLSETTATSNESTEYAVEPTEEVADAGPDSGEASSDGGDAGSDSQEAPPDGGDAASDAAVDAAPVLQRSTHGAWCEEPLPIVAVTGVGPLLNNPYDNLSQADATLLERLTICPGEQTEYCDATPSGELVAVMMRECELPPQVCPVDGAPVVSGCSQTTMENIYSGEIVETSSYIAQGCCFEGQLGEVYTESCTMDLEGARCPASAACLDLGYCVQGVCVDGPARNCDDGFFCNGEEYCVEEVGCMPGPVPQFDDDRCTDDRCSEVQQSVSHEPVAECEIDVCGSPLQVNVGVALGAASQPPDLDQVALNPYSSVVSATISLECGEQDSSEVLPSGTSEGMVCALTDAGEVVVHNEWGIAVSQPASSGCTYEMYYREVKLAGSNGYEWFAFACCLGASPFDPMAPNVEPLPAGP